MNDNNSFRILSLDGGGVRGYLTALILAKIEKRLNEELGESCSIGRRFDLIAGTSTGAIIALALALEEYSAADLVGFYEKNAQSIFGKPKMSCMDRLRHLLHLGSMGRPKYASEPLKEALQRYYGSKTLNDVETDVCICSIALQTGLPRFYKSAYFERNKERLGESLVDIALASAAAPAFFPPHKPAKHSGLLVDGGLCANNPVISAIVDGLNIKKPQDNENVQFSLDDLQVLSIGTGQPCGMPFDARKLKKAGKLQWVLPKPFFSRAGAVPLVETFTQAQSALADAQAKFLLKGHGRYTRINPRLPFAYPLDDIDCMDELKNVADTSWEIEKSLKDHFGIA